MDPLQPQVTRRLLLAGFFAGLILLGFQVLHHFIIPVAWAGILVYVTWPFSRRLRTFFGGRHTPSALVMTVALIQIQVSLEEQHLQRLHGDDYADYCHRVPRWL